MGICRGQSKGGGHRGEVAGMGLVPVDADDLVMRLDALVVSLADLIGGSSRDHG